MSDKMADIIDRNFDLRARIFPISEANLQMVQLARSTGASCKFCGSGGAVVGTYENDKMLAGLKEKLEGERCEIITPNVVEDMKS